MTSNIKVSEDYKSLLDKDKIILPGIGNMKTITEKVNDVYSKLTTNIEGYFSY